MGLRMTRKGVLKIKFKKNRGTNDHSHFHNPCHNPCTRPQQTWMPTPSRCRAPYYGVNTRKTKTLEKYFFQSFLKKGFSVAHTCLLSLSLHRTSPFSIACCSGYRCCARSLSLLHCLLFWLQVLCLLSPSLTLFSVARSFSLSRVSLSIAGCCALPALSSSPSHISLFDC